MDNKRVKLRYEGDMIIMELYVDFFCDRVKIEFELYKEMVPQKEKDKKLIELYFINKRNYKIIKELQKNHINNLNGVFDLNDEPSSNTIEESRGESNYDEE